MDQSHEPNDMQAPAEDHPSGGRAPGRFGFAVLSAVAIVAIAVAAWFVYADLRDKAAARSAVSLADEHYAAAINIVADIEPKLTGVSLADRSTIASDVASLTGSLVKDLGRAEREVGLSRSAIGALDDPQARADYEHALTELSGGLDSLGAMIGYLGSSSDVLQHLVDATQTFALGDALVNDSVAAANKRKWPLAQTKARSAITRFKQAEQLFGEGAKSHPESQLSAAVAYAVLYRQDAELALRMAQAGNRSDVTAYNRLSAQLNTARAAAARRVVPAALTDPSWTQKRLDEYGKDVTKRMADADRAMAEARQSIDRVVGRS